MLHEARRLCDKHARHHLVFFFIFFIIYYIFFYRQASKPSVGIFICLFVFSDKPLRHQLVVFFFLFFNIDKHLAISWYF